LIRRLWNDAPGDHVCAPPDGDARRFGATAAAEEVAALMTGASALVGDPPLFEVARWSVLAAAAAGLWGDVLAEEADGPSLRPSADDASCAARVERPKSPEELDAAAGAVLPPSSSSRPSSRLRLATAASSGLAGAWLGVPVPRPSALVPSTDDAAPISETPQFL